MPPALAWPALRAGNGGGICCADGTVIAVHVKLIGNQGVAHGGRLLGFAALPSLPTALYLAYELKIARHSGASRNPCDASKIN